MANIITCKHAVPLYCSVIENKKDSNSKLAVVSYLCRDKFDALFIIDRAVTVNTEEDILAFECLPYAEFETDFISRKLEHKWLGEYLDRYTTNFQFHLNDNKSRVYTYGVKSGTKKRFKIDMTNDVFMSLVFLDNYPLNIDSDSDADLSNATIYGASPYHTETELIVPTNVERDPIITTFEPVPLNIFDKIKYVFKKPGIETVEVGSVYNINDKRKLSILDYERDVISAIDVSIYFGKGNQYKCSLKVDDVLIDNKKYLVIRSCNKKGNTIIALLDKDKIN